MKKILLMAIAVCLVAGTVLAKDYEIVKKAGGYDVKINLDKNPPVVGKNIITVALSDSSGKAISDAKVVVNYGMPAMPGMPAMNYKTATELKKGRYEASLDFSAKGPWYIQVKLTRGGKTETVKLNLDVQ